LINVELTAGGGGKSESRLAKVRERNKALLGQRVSSLMPTYCTGSIFDFLLQVKRVEKHEENGPSLSTQPQKPQRHSMTSGLEHTPMIRKTWTVGDVDDKQSRRGHRKKSKSRVQLWATGANAIPVD
jgi:nucleolar protein 6